MISRPISHLKSKFLRPTQINHWPLFKIDLSCLKYGLATLQTNDKSYNEFMEKKIPKIDENLVNRLGPLNRTPPPPKTFTFLAFKTR